MAWSDDLLKAIVQQRLHAASPPPVSVDSLTAFAHGFGPVDLDQLLIREAQGSPRRLLALIRALFQHRAQSWHLSSAEDGKPGHGELESGKLYISPADWAIVLEDGILRQSKRRRSTLQERS